MSDIGINDVLMDHTHSFPEESLIYNVREIDNDDVGSYSKAVEKFPNYKKMSAEITSREKARKDVTRAILKAYGV